MQPIPSAVPSPSSEPRTPAVAGGPRILLRAEGAAAFVAAVVAYGALGGHWGLFAALFLVPDLSMLGYLAGPCAGAIAYNATHSYVGPAALGLAGLAAPALLPVAAIWVAHVGFDRLLGYGLKYASGFGDTHLGRLAARRRRARDGACRVSRDRLRDPVCSPTS